MPLSWERRHLTDKTWHFKRPYGKTSGERPEGSFCFLLDTDTGDGTKELLLDTSTPGVDEYCLQLDTSTT